MESRQCRPAHTARSVAMCLAAGVAAFTMLLTGGQPARADETLTLIDKIDVGGNGLGAFDISFVDPSLDLYVLSDRTNASVDFIDSNHDNFLFRVGGFKGVVLTNGVANNSLSGPDGVVIVNNREEIGRAHV